MHAERPSDHTGIYATVYLHRQFGDDRVAVCASGMDEPSPHGLSHACPNFLRVVGFPVSGLGYDLLVIVANFRGADSNSGDSPNTSWVSSSQHLDQSRATDVLCADVPKPAAESYRVVILGAIVDICLC